MGIIPRGSSFVPVADSLDAGTDNIGRCYSSVKTFEMLIDELRAGSGTRYDPAVAALLDDEAFAAYIRDGFTAKRREIYCNAYRLSEDALSADSAP